MNHPSSNPHRFASRDRASASGRSLPVARADLENRLEANARLLTFSRAAIENLYQQIDNPASAILLADRHGLILSRLGRPDGTVTATRLFSTECEAATDRNAIGAVPNQRTTGAMPGELPDFDRGHFLTCVATPIFAPDGSIAGVLDIASDARGDLAHTHALLRTTVELIEHRLIEGLEDCFLSVHFHAHRELIGGPLEALVAFDEDGRLIASNRLARRLLAIDAPHLDGTCGECFTTLWSGLVGWAALRQGRPFPLRTVRGQTFHARATLHASRPAPAHHSRTGCGSTPVPGMALGDARIADIVASLKDFHRLARPLLIEGETGAGKTHLTQVLHDEHRATATAALVTLDCMTVAAGEQGLTEALAALEQAAGGTLVLRQVGRLAPEHQVQLFAAGSRASDTLLIATTTRPIATLISAGQLAIDAFTAHDGCTVSLPPLRERSDFAALVKIFVRELCTDRHIYICPDAITLLRRHSWPGNLSELRSRLKLILALMGDSAHQLCPEDIPDELLDDDGMRER